MIQDAQYEVAVDLHTHIGRYPDHMTEGFLADAQRSWGEGLRFGQTTVDDHWEEMRHARRAVVLGFQARASGFVLPNDEVAEYVGAHPDKLVGFASVDPKDPGAPEELRRAVDDLGLRGLKLGPIYQDVHPSSKEALGVCETAAELGTPILWHQGTTFVEQAQLSYANPVLLDEVASRFPALKMVIAHMGHPWVDEAVVVARKHPNVYLDVSGLHPRPWQLYNALMGALEYRVDDKLLFGSDFPFFTIRETVEGLFSVVELTRGTRLPHIPPSLVEELIHRDALEILEIP